MLPRLQAEERLNAISDFAVGGGAMEARDQEEVIAALRTDAGIAQPKVRKASPMALEGMGIGCSGPAPAIEKAVNDG